MPSRDQLWLWPDEPWEGQSPRALTAGAYVLYLRREPGGMSCPDPLELEMWPVATKKRLKEPRQAAGASSLLPLPLKRRKSRRFGPRRDFTQEDYDG